MCVWWSVYVSAGTQEGQKCLIPGDGAIGYYEPPNVGARNCSQVPDKNRKCS